MRDVAGRVRHEMRRAETGGCGGNGAQSARRRADGVAEAGEIDVRQPVLRDHARIAAAARGTGSIGITRSACIDGGEEKRVVAGIGADIDDAQPARQPLGEEAQLLLLEEEPAHLLALDDRVEPRIGEPQRRARRSGAA